MSPSTQEISEPTRAHLIQTYLTLEQPEQAYKLTHCRFDRKCHLPYCPSCSKWRAKQKQEALISSLETIRDSHPRSNLWAVGLTTRDVKLPSIHAEVSLMLKGWWQFQHDHLSGQGIYGWARRIEACPALNKDYSRNYEYDLHPHVHAVVSARQRTRVPDAEELTEQWRLAAGLDYSPKVAYIKPVDSLEGYSKYILKAPDMEPILAEGAEYFAEYEQQMRGRHLIQAGGLLAGIFGKNTGRFDTAL